MIKLEELTISQLSRLINSLTRLAYREGIEHGYSWLGKDGEDFSDTVCYKKWEELYNDNNI